MLRGGCTPEVRDPYLIYKNILWRCCGCHGANLARIRRGSMDRSRWLASLVEETRQGLKPDCIGRPWTDGPRLPLLESKNAIDDRQPSMKPQVIRWSQPPAV